jgi:hypothetical protein
MLEIVKAIGQEQMKSEIPAFEIGDTVIIITNRETPILQFNDIFA